VSESPRARKERLTGRTAQVKSRGQGSYGLDVRPTSLPAFERAHAMNRKTRNRRELLLREAGSLAETFQLRAE
jgi:hypothetical protein